MIYYISDNYEIFKHVQRLSTGIIPPPPHHLSPCFLSLPTPSLTFQLCCFSKEYFNEDKLQKQINVLHVPHSMDSLLNNKLYSYIAVCHKYKYKFYIVDKINSRVLSQIAFVKLNYSIKSIPQKSLSLYCFGCL